MDGSELTCVKIAVARGHLGLAIVLVHLGERDSLGVELGAGLLPPDGEVLTEGAAEVATMRRGLRHNLRERLARPLPVGALDGEEAGESEGSGQTQNEVLGLSTKNGTQERVGEEPARSQLNCTLGGKLLQLVSVELLHLDDLPFAEVIIIDVGEPVPVLARAERAIRQVSRGTAHKPGFVQRALHGHDHGAALVLLLLVVHFTQLSLL